VSVIPNIHIGYRAHAVPVMESHSPACAVTVKSYRGTIHGTIHGTIRGTIHGTTHGTRTLQKTWYESVTTKQRDTELEQCGTAYNTGFWGPTASVYS